MDDSWRFRPTIQSNPPPPFSHPHPHPHPHPPPYIHYSTVRPPPPPYEFLDLDPLRKRMRVEDPNPQRPPAWDNERRLSLIREHGRQDPANIGVDHCRFDSLPNYQNFDSGYQNLQERRGFYEYGDNSYQNLQERRDVFEYDRQILEKEHDRPFHHNERSSYSLPKQNSYETMPRIPNYEQGRYPPNVGNEIRKLPFDANHFNHVPYESSDYRVHSSQMYPPLPPQPPLPPPPPPESSPPPSFGVRPLVAAPPHMLTPVPVKVSGHLFPTPPVSQGSLEARSMGQSGFYSEMPVRNINGLVSEGLPLIHQTPSKEYPEGREQAFSLRNSVKDKATVIDACHLFRQPHRASRPDRIVVILRGLPGSGKSYMAKALRDLEVETGGNAPRIHAMDDYFMIEVEKVEDNDGSKCSGSSRGRKQTIKKVIEYCYEPELEEAYRSSMMKAFKKTLDEGNFTFIIVDDRNLRVADFAQFWAIAKRSGYEVYLLEATYKDPTGCAARNVHGFTVEEIRKMADQWEEAPSLYLQLNIQSLFCGDNLNERSIQEVDMDTDDTACDNEEPHMSIQREDSRIEEPKSSKHTLDSGIVKIGERWNSDDEEDELIGVKKLGNSKWSKDEVDDVRSSDGARRNLSALSGLIQAYGKGGKSVHWGDKVGKSGFSIGVVKKQNPSSLIIGPGSGYNLSSNPIQEDDDALKTTEKRNINDSKNRFTLQLRAERESFKAVFDRRRQRIGGLWDVDDE